MGREDERFSRWEEICDRWLRCAVVKWVCVCVLMGSSKIGQLVMRGIILLVGGEMEGSEGSSDALDEEWM